MQAFSVQTRLFRFDSHLPQLSVAEGYARSCRVLTERHAASSGETDYAQTLPAFSC